jgi:triacylglycerol lipase
MSWILLVAAACGCSPARPAPIPANVATETRVPDCVVLVHGLWRTEGSFRSLARRLEGEGFAVAAFGYPSRKGTVAEHAGELARALPQLVPADAPRVHFVTHSLGGIVVRQLVHERGATAPLDRLGRVVMLAPPNQGSELADVLRRNRVARWLCGPVLAELGTGSADPPRRLGPVAFECGVLTGDRTWLGPLLFPGPSDGKVSIESARVDGMADFLVVPHGHSFLMNADDVQRQVVAFLRNGRFDRPGSAAGP